MAEHHSPYNTKAQGLISIVRVCHFCQGLSQAIDRDPTAALAFTKKPTTLHSIRAMHIITQEAKKPNKAFKTSSTRHILSKPTKQLLYVCYIVGKGTEHKQSWK
jgi:hypothetical protein